MNQVRCLVAELCDSNGAYLVATDQGYGDNTDFIMSQRAFLKLGRDDNASQELKKYGTLDIEYKRVPCTYTGNVLFYIKETSSNPGYFALVILNVNGIHDVTAVEMWQVHIFITLSNCSNCLYRFNWYTYFSYCQ